MSSSDPPPPPKPRKKSSSSSLAAASASSLFAASSATRKRSGSAFSKAEATRRDSMYSQAVLQEGWLEKQSSGAMIKKWQSRYFELVRGPRLRCARPRPCLFVDLDLSTPILVAWSCRRACVVPLYSPGTT